MPTLVGLAALLAFLGPSAADTPPGEPVTIDGTEVAPRRAEQPVRPRRLDLGRYGTPRDGEELRRADADALLRFESDVEVIGVLEKDLNATMAVWWRHFDFEYSIYGRGYNLPEGNSPSINLMPLVDWAAKQLKNYRRNRENDRQAAPPPE